MPKTHWISIESKVGFRRYDWVLVAVTMLVSYILVLGHLDLSKVFSNDRESKVVGRPIAFRELKYFGAYSTSVGK
jgi:hypothetical protein